MSKVPVTMRALVQRINRKLKPEWRRLHACRRNSRVWRDLGDYYVVDTYNEWSWIPASLLKYMVAGLAS
jgi:hypothetical protein